MKKRQSTHKINRKLFLMADTQMGYFTAKQAVKAGIPDSNHGYYVNAGQWEKEMRGIYRLTNYPISDQEELMIWYLWSQGRDGTPKGTLSHETALDLYELSDINPSKIHLTVPKKFRRFNAIPKIIVLHKGEMQKEEIKLFLGMKITTPFKTLTDIISEGKLSIDLIREAVNQAHTRGLITQKQLNNNPKVKKYLRLKRKKHIPLQVVLEWPCSLELRS